MEYSEIIQNILSDSNLIAQCEDTLENIKNNDTQAELIYVARHLSLDKIDFVTRANASDNFKEILDELNTITINDTCVDTVISLQLSNILDHVLQKLSKADQKIYIYRYFYAHSIDAVASLCNCSTSNVTKSLSSTNSTLKEELKKENIQCNANTFLRSFADIDILYLNATIDTDSKISDEDNTPSKKPFIPWKKLLNISFAVLFVILIITNLYFITDGFGLDNNFTNTIDKIISETEQVKEDDNLIIYINNTKTVNTERLKTYINTDNSAPSDFVYEMNDYIADYNSFAIVKSAPLEQCLGTEITELKDENNRYYQLKGRNSKDYIIQKTKDKYYLHILVNISKRDGSVDEYMGKKLSHVSEGFYGLSESYDIDNITVQHASTNMNFDDIKVKKLIDSPGDIDKIFEIISTSECKGLIFTDFNHEGGFSHNFLMQTSVQLFIEKKDGTIIDYIYYRPEYHYFFSPDSYLVYVPNEDNPSIYTYLDSMLGFAQHKVEPTHPEEWTIEAELSGANPDYISVSVNQTLVPISGLYIAEDFILEQYVDGTWVELPIINGYNADKLSVFSKPLSFTGVTTNDFNIISKYVRPDMVGKYRFSVKIYDSNSEDLSSPTYRIYPIEFEFGEQSMGVQINTWPN